MVDVMAYRILIGLFILTIVHQLATPVILISIGKKNIKQPMEEPKGCFFYSVISAGKPNKKSIWKKVSTMNSSNYTFDRNTNKGKHNNFLHVL